VKRSGQVATRHLPLSADGRARTSVAFDRTTVAAVELTVVNASIRTDCWRGTVLACQGKPKDSGRRFTASFQAYR
jgi:hypothetical protein